MDGTEIWFRRRSFSAAYADSTPKWHLLEERAGVQLTAMCEYQYTFLYESPLTAEEAPDRDGCCRRCLAFLAPPSPLPVAGRRRAVVRFPNADEQARGMTIVPRNKRLAG